MENNKITLSSILDYVYCKRRYYLRYIERQTESEPTNAYMELGRQEHEVIDKSSVACKDGKIVVTNMTVHSEQYNLYGICDVVEFEESGDGYDIPEFNTKATIMPIEFKHGKVRHCNEYIAQVVAQAICLEEKYHCNIKYGCIYFVDAKEYFKFDISESYRKMVTDAIVSINELINHSEIVYPNYRSRKCKQCSMYDVCTPEKISVDKYLAGLWED